MSTAPVMTVDAILADARRQSGLNDFGAEHFIEPLGVLLEAVRTEAHLTDVGAAGQRARMVNGLVNRMRMIDAVKRHPEILDEEAQVAAVVVGLPRTGSTMFHRMLSTAPGITAIKWWETQNFAPFPGEERGNPIERRRLAETIMDGYVKAGLMSIHPFAIDAPDEEIIILDQFFCGTMPESAMYVPSFAKWTETADQRPAYRDLRTVLKFLTWQDQTRKGKRYVMKTPGHLNALDALVDTFPEAKIIGTHRDPAQTVPSYCSMCASLMAMASDTVDRVKVGRFTEKRWAGMLSRSVALREKLGSDRFIDVRYEDLLKSPLDQARRVLSQFGIEMTPVIEEEMKEFLAENAREKRAAHHYTLEEFGLTEAMLQEDFAGYRARFLG